MRARAAVRGSGCAVLTCLLGAWLAACAAAQARREPHPCPKCASDSTFAWNWPDECHETRWFPLTRAGTFGELLLSATPQIIAAGDDAGDARAVFSYLATVEQNLWRGAGAVFFLEGGTTRTLDPVVGDPMGTNGLARPADVYVSRLFLLQRVASVQAVAGKIDLSDYFDGNEYANCEYNEFLANPLINDATIPFPDTGPGVAFNWMLPPHAYLLGAIADAGAVATESRLEPLLEGETRAFLIGEIGIAKLPTRAFGTYRLTLWRTPDETAHGAPIRENEGFGLSFDQQLAGRLQLFFRHGEAEHAVDGLARFWSLGAHLDHAFGRTHDELAIGWASGSNHHDTETLIEVDYRAQLTAHLRATPLVQFVRDPLGRPHDDTVLVAGLRAIYSF